MPVKGVFMKSSSVKKIAAACAAVLCASSLGLFAACGTDAAGETSDSVCVVSIEKSDGGYTVVYSDGTTEFLEAVGEDGEDGVDGEDGADGEDGKDGEDLTISAIWQAYIQETGEDLTLAQFIEQYLSLSADSSAAVGTALLSCVSIYCEFIETQSVGGGNFFPGGGMGGITSSQLVQSAGSGIIYEIDEDSVYIVTNYHVVYYGSADEEKNGGSKTARDIYCYLYGSECTPTLSGYDEDGYYSYNYGSYAIECEYIGGSYNADIAVLRADKDAVYAVNQNVRAVTFAEDYHVGESVYAIGNAESEGITATEGIIGVDSDYVLLDVDEDGEEESHRSIRFDATIYHGNSGGGLFNAKGELVGVANAGIEGYESMCYAIPGAMAKGAADNILYHYRDGDDSTEGVYTVSAKNALGLIVSVRNTSYSLDEEGYGRITEDIVAYTVKEGSLAEQAGLAENDRIVAVIIDGERYDLERSFEIDDIFLTLRPGDELKFAYEREGAEGVTAGITVTSDMFEKSE